MNNTYYNLGNRYAGDVANFNEWFAAEMETSKDSRMSLNAISYIMKKLRLTPGLVDTIEFLNDIYDRLELSVDYINIMHIKPGAVTSIWAAKMRSRPMIFGVDNMYDPALANRNAMMFIPLSGANDLLKVQWLSQEDSDAIVGPEPEMAMGHTFESFTSIDIDAFIVDINRKCMYDNKANSNHAFFLQIGFEGNPSFEEVKAKFETLK